MRAKTTKTEQAWQSPDGSRTIWKVVLETDGKQYPLQTFSQKIAEVGFEGDVETYLSKKGDRFVRQVAKERNYSGGNQRSDAATQESIARAVALKAAVDLFAPGQIGDITIPATLNVADQFLSWLQNSGSSGNQGDSTPPTATTNEQSSPAVAAPDPVYDIDDEPINLDQIPF